MSFFKGFPPEGLDEAIQKAITRPMIFQAKPSDGIGYRITTLISIETNKSKWIIEIFAETFIRNPPRNPRLGYTLGEFEANHGVNLSKVVGESSLGEKLSGEFMKIKDFEKYINDSATRVILYRFLDEMKNKITPDEEDVEKYTTMYMQRDTTTTLFTKEKYN